MSYKATFTLYEGPLTETPVDVPDLSAFDHGVLYAEVVTSVETQNASASCGLYEVVPESGTLIGVAVVSVGVSPRVARTELPVLYGSEYKVQVRQGGGLTAGFTFRVTLVASTSC